MKLFVAKPAMIVCVALLTLHSARANPPAQEEAQPLAANSPNAPPSPPGIVIPDLFEPLPLQLPQGRAYSGPANPAKGNLDPYEPHRPRPPFFAPKGAVNLARGKPVTSSDPDPIIGSLDQITDGDKQAADGSFVELAEGKQWVQIDLCASHTLAAIVFWHRHDDDRIYHAVVVQVSNDPKFRWGITTLFNNDTTSIVSHDYEYRESYEGKLVDAKQAKARYVRLYSKGSTSDEQNHYTEVEVWGLPAAK
jgi:hypothetical protein